jgi:hypothetical protein
MKKKRDEEEERRRHEESKKDMHKWECNFSATVTMGNFLWLNFLKLTIIITFTVNYKSGFYYFI